MNVGSDTIRKRPMFARGTQFARWRVALLYYNPPSSMEIAILDSVLRGLVLGFLTGGGSNHPPVWCR